MSYDLMVFAPTAPTTTKQEFMEWYSKQTEWSESHSYDDPKITTPELRDWFMEMIKEYPPMNGPHSTDDVDNLKMTDYSIGNTVIYAAFAWSEANAAYSTMFNLAEKYGLGFFDVSSDDGGVWTVDESGRWGCVLGNGTRPSMPSKKGWRFWKHV